VRSRLPVFPIATNTFCGYYGDLKYGVETLLKDTQVDAIRLLCIIICFALPLPGLRHLRGLKPVIIASEVGCIYDWDGQVSTIFEQALMMILRDVGFADKVKIKALQMKEFRNMELDCGPLPLDAGLQVFS
jgi:hypothetical protein